MLHQTPLREIPIYCQFDILQCNARSVSTRAIWNWETHVPTMIWRTWILILRNYQYTEHLAKSTTQTTVPFNVGHYPWFRTSRYCCCNQSFWGRDGVHSRAYHKSEPKHACRMARRASMLPVTSRKPRKNDTMLSTLERCVFRPSLEFSWQHRRRPDCWWCAPICHTVFNAWCV